MSLSNYAVGDQVNQREYGNWQRAWFDRLTMNGLVVSDWLAANRIACSHTSNHWQNLFPAISDRTQTLKQCHRGGRVAFLGAADEIQEDVPWL